MTKKEMLKHSIGDVGYHRYKYLVEKRNVYIRQIAKLKEERKENVKEHKTSSDILSLAGLESEQKYLREIQKQIEEFESKGM